MKRLRGYMQFDFLLFLLAWAMIVLLIILATEVGIPLFLGIYRMLSG